MEKNKFVVKVTKNGIFYKKGIERDYIKSDSLPRTFDNIETGLDIANFDKTTCQKFWANMMALEWSCGATGVDGLTQNVVENILEKH